MKNSQASKTRPTKTLAARMRSPQLVWIAGDLLATVPAFYFATFLRFAGDFSEAYVSVGSIGPRALLFSGLILFGLFVTGMYRTRLRILPAQILSHAAVAVAIAVAVVAMSSEITGGR